MQQLLQEKALQHAAANGQPTYFDLVAEFNHEQVVVCNDAATGLRAIIGIHNTVLGPALGGLRFWNYENDVAALVDVLRLSRGMTFKAAISGLNLGGGKAVIIGDAKKLKNEYLLRRFGKFVESLNGKYITAEDVNIGVKDIEYVMQETRHVAGIPPELGGSGDPSPVTAYGVYIGMKAAHKFVYGKDSLEGKKIVVQGVGKVGRYLTEHLRKEGATVYIYDLYSDAVAQVASSTGAIPITAEQVYTTDMDIYAPCALGGTVNPDTLPQLKCAIIAGGANNQLLDEQRDGKAVVDKGIVYAPDFLINAGGLINVYTELEGGYTRERAITHADKIYDTTLLVLETARTEHITPQEAAIRLANQRIEKIGNIKKVR